MTSGERLDEIIKAAKSPNDYADHDGHIYELYRLIGGLAEEVRRLNPPPPSVRRCRYCMRDFASSERFCPECGGDNDLLPL